MLVTALLVSCLEQPSETSIALDNNLGTLTIQLPELLDSHHKSYHRSDCGCCCASRSHTFYNSKLDNYPIKDTFDYFTEINLENMRRYALVISQPACADCSGETTNLKSTLQGQLSALIAENPNRNILDFAIVQIDSLDFVLMSMRSEYRGQIKESLSATTYIKDGPLTFNFIRIGEKPSDFISVSKTALNSIELEHQ